MPGFGLFLLVYAQMWVIPGFIPEVVIPGFILEVGYPLVYRRVGSLSHGFIPPGVVNLDVHNVENSSHPGPRAAC